MALLRNFNIVLTVAAHLEKSGTAYSRIDLVQRERLFWKRVKEIRHLFVQHQLGHKHKIYWNFVKKNIFLLLTIDI